MRFRKIGVETLNIASLCRQSNGGVSLVGSVDWCVKSRAARKNLSTLYPLCEIEESGCKGLNPRDEGEWRGWWNAARREGGGEIGLAATRTTMTGFRMGEKGGGGMLKYKINILNPA